MELNMGGEHIAVYHSHHKPTLCFILTDSSYDIVCLGHTHKPMVEKLPNKLIVNPG